MIILFNGKDLNCLPSPLLSVFFRCQLGAEVVMDSLSLRSASESTGLSFSAPSHPLDCSSHVEDVCQRCVFQLHEKSRLCDWVVIVFDVL